MQNVQELEIPQNDRSRLASAIMGCLQFAASITDFVLHEGQPIMVKSASGVVPITSLNVPGGHFEVSEVDIKQFLSTYVDAMPARASASEYFDQTFKPELDAMREVHRSMRIGQGKDRSYLRVTLFRHAKGRLAMVLRLVRRPPELESIGLAPPIFERLRANPRGLLILTGPTGSGKTSTALSILSYLNQHQSGHIVTIEDPIEYELEGEQCVITQRQVGVDVSSFGAGLSDALRQAPEAVLASEIRTRDCAEASILGAESGALMLVTTHGRSILGTLRKLLALCGDNAEAMRTVLAGGLIGVIRQELAPMNDGTGYVLLQESLLASEAVTQALARGDWRVLEQIVKAQSPTADFHPMHPRLRELVQARKIEMAVADQIGRSAAFA